MSTGLRPAAPPDCALKRGCCLKQRIELPLKSCLDIAPVKLSTTVPFLKKTMVGIPITSYCEARSVFIHVYFNYFQGIAFSRATSSKTGASILRGPHQGAQKSTSTGASLDYLRVNWPALISLIPAIMITPILLLIHYVKTFTTGLCQKLMPTTIYTSLPADQAEWLSHYPVRRGSADHRSGQAFQQALGRARGERF